jgi:hypothetical protein
MARTLVKSIACLESNSISDPCISKRFLVFSTDNNPLEGFVLKGKKVANYLMIRNFWYDSINN